VSTARIAIAGAWGYIGRKFLDAARSLGLETFVYDPGPLPEDVELGHATRVPDEADFYRLEADLFHLALHPEHRGVGLTTLLERGRRETVLVLCEKPMASPERPEQCEEIIAAVEQSGAIVLYDFPELFDPITRRIHEFLAGLRNVKIESFEVQRSKDREAPDNPRNYKRMVPIQYQESVHCLAFVLHLLATLGEGIESVFAEGLRVTAAAAPYQPPNPDVYRYVADGRCEYRLALGPVQVVGRTDFKRGAEWAKRRIVRGTADEGPFTIEADYLEERKRLVINGRSQDDVVATDSYQEAIRACLDWKRRVPRDELKRGLYPNPPFAHLTYQLSSALWRSSREQRTLAFRSRDELMSFDAGFAAALPHLPRYRQQACGDGGEAN
jgi:predicted dehydrogenase